MAFLWHFTDMRKALSELGFVNRETLIVVPRSSVAGLYKGKSSSHENTRTTAGDSDPSSNNGGGLFGYLRRLLSAMNPFSYSGSTSSPSSSVSPSSNGLWEYRESITLLHTFCTSLWNKVTPFSENCHDRHYLCETLKYTSTLQMRKNP